MGALFSLSVGALVALPFGDGEDLAGEALGLAVDVDIGDVVPVRCLAPVSVQEPLVVDFAIEIVAPFVGGEHCCLDMPFAAGC